LIQDAANFSRFGVTIKVGYMSADAEKALLIAKTGVQKSDADDLVRWAGLIRESFDGGRIGMTVGPREILHAAKIGMAFADFKKGINLAIVNRFNSIDSEIATEIMQRIYG
jgi:cobaltochelatase CobS